MPSKLKFGPLVPGNFLDPMPDPHKYIEFFQASESLAFDTLWSTERVLGQPGVLDPFTALAWAAGTTSTIGLGTAVVLSSFRRPVMLAKAAASMDHISTGRFSLGISLGGRVDEFEALGIPLRQRPRRFDETIAIIRHLWSKREVSYTGRHFNLDRVTISPRPPAGRSIPVLLGGGADPVLRRVASVADGWIAGSSANSDQMAQRVENLRAYAQEAGRNPSTLEIGKLIYTAVDATSERARTRLEGPLKAYYGSQYDVDKLCAFGSPQDCASAIQPYLDAGATTILFGLTSPDVNELELMKREVLPLLRYAGT